MLGNLKPQAHVDEAAPTSVNLVRANRSPKAHVDGIQDVPLVLVDGSQDATLAHVDGSQDVPLAPNHSRSNSYCSRYCS